jgi:hypothetical protein
MSLLKNWQLSKSESFKPVAGRGSITDFVVLGFECASTTIHRTFGSGAKSIAKYAVNIFQICRFCRIIVKDSYAL